MPIGKPISAPKVYYPVIADEWKLLCIILPINLLQSYLSRLLNDEPYYWVYSRYLSTGYLDHPPLIAWLIRLSSFILPGEIGVRLITTLAGSFTFFFLYKLTRQEAGGRANFKLLSLILLSCLFLNLYSFLALPDTLLLFFGVLFLYDYRQYLKNDQPANSITLGIISALLLYSKYHGILLIGFTLLSNPKLFTKKSFYIACCTTVILLIPHVYWQIQHNYATIRFQLFNRETPFKLKHILSYIGEQMAVTGPVVLLVCSLLYTPKNQFQRALKFNVLGIFIFFLLSAFKKNINVHWTGIAFPPMLCLTYLYLSSLNRFRAAVTSLLIVNLLAVVFLRINFVFNWVRVPHFNDIDPKVMLTELQKKAPYPIVFENKYDEPSYYMFYRRHPCFAINTFIYKKTQFNYLPQLEEQFEGRTVSLITTHVVNKSSVPVFLATKRSYWITTVPNFASFCSVYIQSPDLKKLNAGRMNVIHFSVENSLSKINITQLHRCRAVLTLTMMNRDTEKLFSFSYPHSLDFSTTLPTAFQFKAPAEQGHYRCIFSVTAANNIAPVFNSDIYDVDVD